MNSDRIIVLGLDQAPAGSGWAVGDGMRPPQRGYKQFPDYGENESALIGTVIDWLVTLAKSSGAEAIYTEQIILSLRHPNIPVLIKQAAIVAAVATVCSKHFLNLPHYQAEISSWRKRCGIMGPDWKQAALQWSLAQGWPTDNHHVAEATGIWHFGLCELNKGYRHHTEVSARRQSELHLEHKVGFK